MNTIHHLSFHILILGLVLLSAACGSTPIATVVVVVVSTPTPAIRPTLPLTWTPTFTPSPALPTSTLTSTPMPTVTPTLSAVDLCRSFWVVSNLTSAKADSGTRYFNIGNVITVLVNTPSPDDQPRFLAVHRLSGENRGIDLSGGQSVAGQLPVRELPRTGQYDWTLSLRTPAYGEICQQSGTFLVVGRESTRAEERTIR